MPDNDGLTANEINLTTDEDAAVTVDDLYTHIINVDDIGEHIEDVTYSLSAINDPQHGDCSIEGSVLTYTPDPDYPNLDEIPGEDICYFRVADSHYVSNDAAVNITINPVNDLPVTSDSPTVIINEDATVGDVDNPPATFDLSTLTVDADNDPLTYHLVETGVANNCSIDGTIVTYVPTSNYPFVNDGPGTDTCSFKANDSPSGEDPASDSEDPPGILTIQVNPVNDTPVVSDAAQTINEDATVGDLDNPPAIFDLLELTADVDITDTFTFNLQDTGNNGLCTLDGSIVTYVPNPDYPGTNNPAELENVDTCSFYATDNMGADNSVSELGTLTITVTPINDPPVLSEPLSSIDCQGSDF